MQPTTKDCERKLRYAASSIREALGQELVTMIIYPVRYN
jgi:hypothetical protein